MHRLIPSFISEQFNRNQFSGNFQATTMFIDITGFTAMTQVLMNNGKEGAEVLANVINRVFTPAIEIIYEHGGFVSSFAGDAFTTIFRSNSVAVVEALSAAVRLQGLFLDESNQQTKFGSFVLSMRIGLSHGPVTWRIITHEQQNAFLFGGEAIRRCTGNKQYADSGEVIVDKKVLSKIDTSAGVTYIRKNDRFYSLQSAPTTTAKVVRKTPPPVNQDKFIPQKILSSASGGEFRDIVSCYISFDEKGDLAAGVAKVITMAHRFGGYFNKIDFNNKGGIMLVLFGAPVNPGNLYNRALDFSLAIREIPELSVQIGLTYGIAFTGFVGSELRSEYTALGSVVNLSARFTQKKKRSVIYLDQSIYRQTFSHYKIRELKPRRFKGFKGKTPIYQLTGKKRIAQFSFYEGGMVGRDAELNQLAKLMHPIKNGRFGGIAYIYGNPGIGKSRLAHELTQQQDIRTLILQTDSILRKPLNSFTYFFNHYFEQDEEGSADDRKTRFKTIYQELIGKIVSLSDADKRVKTIKELNRIESIIGSVIGLFWDGSVYDVIDPEDRAVVTQLAIKEFFTALSLTEPIILLIEDIQWLDDGSHAVFEILTREIKDYPLIILACSRFNDDGSRPELSVDDDVPRHEITLSELSGDTTKVLIETRLGNKINDQLAAYIKTRTEGNPFYTRQFCLYLLEMGVIKLQDGHYRLIKEPTDIPTDINMILIARIDRLSAELKEMVQIASVLGREFGVQVLTALIKLLHTTTPDNRTVIKDSEIRPLISRIEEERIWSALTELKYIFNHALLRDAAYDMQLRARLRSLHRLAGDAIVKLYPDDKTIYADSAHHYEQAEDWDKAKEYCQKTGDYLYESVKYDEALAYRQKALAICLKILGKKHPDTAALYNSIGEVLSDKGDYDTALAYHKNALAIRKEIFGEKHQDTAISYDKFGDVHFRKGDYNKALVYHEKALAIQKELLGEKHQDTAESYNNIGMVHLYKGDYDTALAYYEKALAIEKILPGEKCPDKACSYNNIGHVHSVKGNYETALAYYEKALAIQNKTLGVKNPHTATLYNNIGSVHWKKEDYDTALEYNEKALAIQKELLGEKHPATALSYNNIGMAHWRKESFDTALAYYEKALAIRKELLGEKHPDTATSYNNIGGIHRRKGNQDTALAYYEKALAIRKELLGEKHPNTAISLGNIAPVYICQGKYKEAEQLFKQVLAIFEESLGKSHPYTITTLERMTDMYEKTGNETEAERIRKRLKEIDGE
jgi:tetratricopeptide (TPR) repeat protein/class 3 adenylate cyclase